ncbi:MAG: response regulator [Micavibrio sp.]|nr:response regulator [Micavibrio sp.]
MPYSLDRVKILIVDDMMPMLSLVKSILSIYGFKEIYTANDGEEAFDLVCRHDPDLILTDWVMEPMDGLEFTKKVRRSPMSPNPYVPILMMTGFSSRLRVEGSRDAGITEFLVKPFNSKDLCARIIQIIEKPRPFVDAMEFFGPDRRRRDDRGYEGNRKRGDDSERAAKSDEKTTDILKKLREEAKTIS